MTEETKELADQLSAGIIEGLKFIPDGEAEETVKYVVGKLSTADYSGSPNIVTIIHSAVHSGKIISKATATDKDDKFFTILDNIVENYRDNGEKAIAAIFKSLFQKKK